MTTVKSIKSYAYNQINHDSYSDQWNSNLSSTNTTSSLSSLNFLGTIETVQLDSELLITLIMGRDALNFKNFDSLGGKTIKSYH